MDFAFREFPVCLRKKFQKVKKKIQKDVIVKLIEIAFPSCKENMLRPFKKITWARWCAFSTW